MKSILRKVILVLSLAVGLQTNVKAQLVYIPDSAFRSYLYQNLAICMVGDSIDPTCPAVLNTKYIDVFNRGISDLTGIEVFVNDTLLYCGLNKVYNLPTLPSSLKYLECMSCQLTSLPTLPDSLIYLNFAGNVFTNIPTLPDSLKTLICIANSFTSLPALPTSLRHLDCTLNYLTSLPALPSTLNYFNCSRNQITSMPVLPSTLNYFDCSENQITSLPPLPSSMTNLDCSINQLTSLPSLTPLLDTLYCNENQLTSLPPLPNSLTTFECRLNQISVLPPLPNSLIIFYCSNNLLTSLPTLPTSLVRFGCGYNQITNMPSFPSSLRYFGCGHNQITNLPPFNEYLIQVECNDNPLTCLPEIKDVSSLYFVNTLVNCIPNYGNGNLTFCQPSLSNYPICNLFNSNDCGVFWNIQGNCYVDLDTNCVSNIVDHGIPNAKIKLYKNGVLYQHTNANQNGNYYYDTKDYAIYKTELDTTNLPFEINCPSSGFYLDTISLADSIKYDRDFAVKCKGIDLAVTSINSLNLRPASIRTIKIQAGDLTNFYGANCASGVCGTVTITIIGDCSYHSSPSYALAPTSVASNVLTYNIADFGAISYSSTFDFNLLVDTSAVLGNQICITVNVYTKCVQEINYTNNQYAQCFEVVGSFDPNDKAVYPTKTMDLSGNKWLTYTIRFQNTGTASAEHIVITDTISNDLILSTFSFLSSSHNLLVELTLDARRVIKFRFPAINLPDSNTNEPASHGYVQFKIKAKDSLVIGNTIENTANIYFDFNAPVITNTTSNTVIDCNIPTTNLSATLCGDEVYSLNGMEYYSTGIYKQNLLTSFGCDSTVRLNLTVNKSTITRSNDTLQTTTLNAISYQWINCITGTAIAGANTQTFNPTQSGSYAVVIDFGNCVDTSACYYFSPVGINEINASNISIQPNPFNTELKITLDKNYEGVLEVYNTIGALIASEKLQSRNVTLNTSNWNAGVYILKVATNNGVVVKKVVKR